ncbi:MAG: TetR/AcrR family transcriptional regulator C-terminal ligand-binding domain-containing protein, partial [Actinomycetia bacterium]|nr:TetR/AcrR family transcriptional regulator C-terminal ligand-binding domain-containing protein [Actinomycetes bacterium]
AAGDEQRVLHRKLGLGLGRAHAPDHEELVTQRRVGGEVGADVDLDLMATVLPAVVLHRTFILGLPTEREMIERIIDEVVMPAATRTS